MHTILLLFSHLVATTTTTAAVPLLLLCSVDADEFPLRTHQTDKINEYNHFFDCNIQRRHVYTLHTAEYLIFVCVQINAWMDSKLNHFINVYLEHFAASLKPNDTFSTVLLLIFRFIYEIYHILCWIMNHFCGKKIWNMFAHLSQGQMHALLQRFEHFFIAQHFLFEFVNVLPLHPI